MDQIRQLLRLADAEKDSGRFTSSMELAACAAVMDSRSRNETEFRSGLIEAARKRRGAKRRVVEEPENEQREVFMPGALPVSVRRAVTKEVAAIFDKHGEELYRGALDDFRKAFNARFQACSEKIKADLRDQYGAQGLSQHLPFMGEFRENVIANVLEYGSEELRRLEQYSPEVPHGEGG